MTRLLLIPMETQSSVSAQQHQVLRRTNRRFAQLASLADALEQQWHWSTIPLSDFRTT